MGRPPGSARVPPDPLPLLKSAGSSREQADRGVGPRTRGSAPHCFPSGGVLRDRSPALRRSDMAPKVMAGPAAFARPARGYSAYRPRDRHRLSADDGAADAFRVARAVLHLSRRTREPGCFRALRNRVSSASEHACAVTTAGHVYCWGSATPALGDGDGTTDLPSPTPVLTLP